MIPAISIAGTSLNFVCGVAFATTFQGRRLRVFQNSTRRLSSAFGYILYDYDDSVLKRCSACSAYNIGKVVREN